MMDGGPLRVSRPETGLRPRLGSPMDPSTAHTPQDMAVSSSQAEEPMSDAEQLQFLVRKTNEVLGTTYSLVSFDAKKGRALLQVLNDLLTHLSSAMEADVLREDPTVVARRLADFLTGILNYRPQNPQEFQLGLTTGDSQHVYPIFHWLLRRMPENRKRVYLAKYLIPLNIPEDMIASDDGVREVFQQYKALVDQFKEVHRTVDRLRAETKAEGTKSYLGQLEQEKEQLTGRVQATQRKLSHLTTSEPVFKACQGLRREVEAERELDDRLAEQMALRKTAEQRIQQARQKAEEIRRNFADMNLEKMMKTLEEEIATNRALALDKLPKDIATCREKVDAAAKALTEPLDAEALAQQVARLQQEIKETEEKAKPKGAPQDEATLGLFRHQAAMAGSRREKLAEETDSVRELQNKLEEELAAKEQEFRGLQGSRILRGEEFKAYANSLRGKSTTYKRIKAELQELRAELGILQHTDELIQQRHQSVARSIDEMEQQRGIQGYRGIQDNLVAISESKMEVDEAKGQTLEELSKVVQDFVTNIHDRRTKLAPQILELRNTRQRSQAIEQEHQQKKEVYDATRQELEDDISRVQEEYDQYHREGRGNESLYHRLHCQILIAEVMRKRAHDEQDFTTGTRKLSEQYKTWAEMLDREATALEAVSRDLRERKKAIEENHEANSQQRRWFQDLRRLLECKIAVYKREAAGHGVPALAGMDMALGGLGVDRLVL